MFLGDFNDFESLRSGIEDSYTVLYASATGRIEKGHPYYVE
jgi:hypothetical protein